MAPRADSECLCKESMTAVDWHHSQWSCLGCGCRCNLAGRAPPHPCYHHHHHHQKRSLIASQGCEALRENSDSDVCSDSQAWRTLHRTVPPALTSQSQKQLLGVLFSPETILSDIYFCSFLINTTRYTVTLK